jgi:hypothetical protein
MLKNARIKSKFSNYQNSLANIFPRCLIKRFIEIAIATISTIGGTFNKSHQKKKSKRRLQKRAQ